MRGSQESKLAEAKSQHMEQDDAREITSPVSQEKAGGHCLTFLQGQLPGTQLPSDLGQSQTTSWSRTLMPAAGHKEKGDTEEHEVPQLARLEAARD